MTPPSDLNVLVRFAEIRNLFSARVPSHFRCSLHVPLRPPVTRAREFLKSRFHWTCVLWTWKFLNLVWGSKICVVLWRGALWPWPSVTPYCMLGIPTSVVCCFDCNFLLACIRKEQDMSALYVRERADRGLWAEDSHFFHRSATMKDEIEIHRGLAE